MGWMDKALEKAMNNLDLEKAVEDIKVKIYDTLGDKGHAAACTLPDDGSWTYACIGCDFRAYGTSGGLTAVDAMASVHLGELNARPEL